MDDVVIRPIRNDVVTSPRREELSVLPQVQDVLLRTAGLVYSVFSTAEDVVIYG